MTSTLTRCTARSDCDQALHFHDLHVLALEDGDPDRIVKTYKAWRRHRNLCRGGKR